METWLDRLQKLIDAHGYNHSEVSVRAGLNRSTVQKYFRDARNGNPSKPGMENLKKIAKVLGTTPDYILYGEQADAPTLIPIVGFASAGEGWSHVPNSCTESVALEIDGLDPIAIEVRGDSMSPVYRNGDTLICSRQTTKHLDNLINQDCVVMTADGEGFIKILKRGTKRGCVTLKSYNPHFEDRENVQLLWVAPILWVRRGR